MARTRKTARAAPRVPSRPVIWIKARVTASVIAMVSTTITIRSIWLLLITLVSFSDEDDFDEDASDEDFSGEDDDDEGMDWDELENKAKRGEIESSSSDSVQTS